MVPIVVMVPEFTIPPPIVLLFTKSATVVPLLTKSPAVVPLTTFPGVIVPALVTAPVTVEPVITIEVVAWPAGLVTVATVWFVIVCPAFAGAARSSAATEVVTRREVAKREWRDGGEERRGAKLRALGGGRRNHRLILFRREGEAAFADSYVHLLASVSEAVKLCAN